MNANNEIKNVLKSLFKCKSEEEIKNYIANADIKSHFKTPSTLYFGELWEACVKYLKYHLKRIIGDNILCYEELLTLVTQMEAGLNSRPICPLSSDLNDVEV